MTCTAKVKTKKTIELDLAIFLLRNMETDEYTNKYEIDETECCPSLKAWKN